MKKQLITFLIAFLSMNYLHAQMTCNKVIGNFVNNYDFEVSEYEEILVPSCPDFPTICGRNYCEWYRAYGKPWAGGYFSSTNIVLNYEEENYLSGVFQNNFILPNGEYQGHIKLLNVGNFFYPDKIKLTLINGLDQNNLNTLNTTEDQIASNKVIASFQNIYMPGNSFITIPFDFVIQNNEGPMYNQLLIYTIISSVASSYHFAIDDLVIKKKLYADAGENRTVCKDIPFTLGPIFPNTTAIGGMPNYLYQWTCNNSSWTSTSANPTLLASVTTTYYVTVKDEGGNGNIATDQVTITVEKMLDISKLKCGFYYLVVTSKENSFTQTLKLIKN